VGRTLLQHWAAALDNPAEVFDSAFAEVPATLIKVIRYPGRADSEQGFGAHRDAGVLTLLLAEPGSRGLQVRTAGSGGLERSDSGIDAEYVDVDPLPGALIVNIGEMLEIASGGYLRATEHRVRIQDTERLSVAAVFIKQKDAQLPVLQLPAELAARARGGTDDPSHDRIYAVYGRNAWKSRVRAHPDVAAAHRYV